MAKNFEDFKRLYFYYCRSPAVVDSLELRLISFNNFYYCRSVIVNTTKSKG